MKMYTFSKGSGRRQQEYPNKVDEKYSVMKTSSLSY